MRSVKRFLFQTIGALFLCASLILGNVNRNVWAKEKEETLQLYAKCAVLMDADSGRVLYGKAEEQFHPNASTTKIMTCILAIESGKLDETVKVSEYAASMPKVHLGMTKGDTFRLKDLLYSLMLESHNDSAVAIAEHVGKSVEEFANMMNKKAEELGCEQTHFITPNGLDAKDEKSAHGTTAKDLATIMSYCIQNETFLEITRTKQYQFSNQEGTKNFVCNNHNAFLQMMDGVLSGKTGFTADAGYCYVGALKRGERTYIVALLACGWPNNKGYKWSDTKKLMKYGLENYEKVLVKVEKNLEALPIQNAADKNYDTDKKILMPISIDGEDIKILKKKSEKVKVTYTEKKFLKAPMKKGIVVGSAEYYIGKEKIASYPLTTMEHVAQRTTEWYFRCIWRNFCFS
ncbi:MAG: D-alanyl-D-alanine carboxypeptidase [Lachnospiraceae bacterium]|nr:D-alanyl-D-alanine carboxypeptidase [Lachnospiraceae bacterium]